MTSPLHTSASILRHLGGSRFIAMTGAKNLVRTVDSLQFKIGAGAKNKANHVTIVLQSDALYTIMFNRVRKFDITHVSDHIALHAGQLQTVFKEQTGFDTHL